MEITAEAMLQSSDTDLLEIYRKSLRLYAEKKFARDSETGRLDWQAARLFAAASGRIADRENAVKLNEAMAKRRQDIRAMTLEIDLLKADIDVLALALQRRGGLAPDLRCAA